MPSLLDYPRPSVAVDTAVLTIQRGVLCVVLVDTPDGPRLPGTFLHEGEVLADAVLRSLRDKAGLQGLTPRQLHVFDDPNRDDRGWVLSVAHVDTVTPERLLEHPHRLVVAVEAIPSLPWDHESIVARAVASLRNDYLRDADPARFLPTEFTLRQLQSVHESVAGARLPRDAFRRAMEPKLVATGGTAEGTVGKPARLFTTGEAVR